MVKLQGFKVGADTFPVGGREGGDGGRGGWISRIRFSASSKMDINFPHGTQKIEILKKLDPLHLENHKKNHLKRLRNGKVMA